MKRIKRPTSCWKNKFRDCLFFILGATLELENIKRYVHLLSFVLGRGGGKGDEEDSHT